MVGSEAASTVSSLLHLPGVTLQQGAHHFNEIRIPPLDKFQTDRFAALAARHDTHPEAHEYLGEVARYHDRRLHLETVELQQLAKDQKDQKEGKKGLRARFKAKETALQASKLQTEQLRIRSASQSHKQAALDLNDKMKDDEWAKSARGKVDAALVEGDYRGRRFPHMSGAEKEHFDRIIQLGLHHNYVHQGLGRLAQKRIYDFHSTANGHEQDIKALRETEKAMGRLTPVQAQRLAENQAHGKEGRDLGFLHRDIRNEHWAALLQQHS